MAQVDTGGRFAADLRRRRPARPGEAGIGHGAADRAERAILGPRGLSGPRIAVRRPQPIAATSKGSPSRQNMWLPFNASRPHSRR